MVLHGTMTKSHHCCLKTMLPSPFLPTCYELSFILECAGTTVWIILNIILSEGAV